MFYINSFELLLCKCWLKPIKKPKESVQTLVISSWALDSKGSRRHVQEQGTRDSCCLTSLGQPERRGTQPPLPCGLRICPPDGSCPQGPAGKLLEQLRKICDFFSPPIPSPPCLFYMLAVAAASCGLTRCTCFATGLCSPSLPAGRTSYQSCLCLVPVSGTCLLAVPARSAVPFSFGSVVQGASWREMCKCCVFYYLFSAKRSSSCGPRHLHGSHGDL